MIKAKTTLENIKPYEIDNFYPNCLLKLDSNENAYGPSPFVIQAIRNFDFDKIKFYPTYGELVETLSNKIGANSNEIVLTNGCDEAISVVLNTYLDKDEEILSFCPTFSMPILYSNVIGAKFIEIEYNKKFEFEYEKFCSKINNKTKILYLTTPNNPTGGIIEAEIIEKIAKNYPNKLVLLDYTYINFAQISINEYFSLPHKYDNIAILKSFSKDYALAGLRLGYIYANNKIINEVKKVISPYSVNASAVCAGLSALADDDFYRENIKKLNIAKNNLADKLNALNYEANATNANFVLCNFGEYSDFIYNKLLNNGIRIKYFKGIKGLENTFRITAPKLEDVDTIINFVTPRPLFVFDLDGVLFDVGNSYRLAIKKTFEYFTKQSLNDFDIQLAKNQGGLSNDWDLTLYLIEKAGFKADYNELVNVFQDYFYRPNKGGFIDNEENILDAAFFEELTKLVDCAVFTGRPREEAFYSLNKFGIKKYFSYFVCNEDVEGNYKPSPFGLNKIKKHIPYTEIYYFGDTVDDISAGMDANVKTYGVIHKNTHALDETIETLKNKGACGIIRDKGEILNEVLCAKLKK